MAYRSASLIDLYLGYILYKVPFTDESGKLLVGGRTDNFIRFRGDLSRQPFSTALRSDIIVFSNGCIHIRVSLELALGFFCV